MSRRLHLIDFTVVRSRPIDLPGFELADASRGALAEDRGEIFVAKPAPRFERIGKMQLRIIGFRLAERGRAGHLCHDACAAATDDVLVDQDGLRAVARGRDGGEHSGCAAACHQHIGRKLDRLVHST